MSTVRSHAGARPGRLFGQSDRPYGHGDHDTFHGTDEHGHMLNLGNRSVAGATPLLLLWLPGAIITILLAIA